MNTSIDRQTATPADEADINEVVVDLPVATGHLHYDRVARAWTDPHGVLAATGAVADGPTARRVA